MSPMWLIFLWTASLSGVYFCDVNWWLNKEEERVCASLRAMSISARCEGIYSRIFFRSPIKSVAHSWRESLLKWRGLVFVVILSCGNPFWDVFSVPCAQMWRGRPATTSPAASRHSRSPAFGRGSTASWPIASSSCSTRRKRWERSFPMLYPLILLSSSPSERRARDGERKTRRWCLCFVVRFPFWGLNAYGWNLLTWMDLVFQTTFELFTYDLKSQSKFNWPS